MAKRNRFEYTPAMEPLAERARRATTNEELAQVCLRMDVADHVFLGKVDIWLAKHALSALYRNLKKYPYMRSRMNYFGTLNGFINCQDTILRESLPPNYVQMGVAQMVDQSLDQMCENVRGCFRQNGLAVAVTVPVGSVVIGAVMVNGFSFHQQSIMQTLAQGEAMGHSPKGCKSVKSVVEHEIGHVLDNLLGIQQHPAFQALLRQCNQYYIATNLSQYAATSPMEMVAEAYSEYCNNPNPRPLATQIGQLIDAEYRNRFERRRWPW